MAVKKDANVDVENDNIDDESPYVQALYRL
jgi:hypothetical protein